MTGSPHHDSIGKEPHSGIGILVFVSAIGIGGGILLGLALGVASLIFPDFGQGIAEVLTNVG